jgi:oxygen-independent coproporphyrinogen-3 oxidase
MRLAGVDRISMGVQSFHDEKLELIGRNAGVEESERALRLLQERWSGGWSMDIISLLPAADAEEARQKAFEDLRSALSYGPDHLSLYGLTAEPGTPFFDRVKSGRAVLPEAGTAAELLLAQWRLLEEHGYLHYEVSNFARDEQAMSLHNMRYWRLEPYLGVGPAAVSTLPAHDGPVRLSFRPDVENYCRDGASGRIHSERLSVFSFLLEHLMTGLRTSEGVDHRRIAQRFGIQLSHSLFRTLEKKIRQYERSGFLERVNVPGRHRLFRRNGSQTRGFRATDHGLMILDSLILDLSGELDHISPETVSWPRG